MTRQLLRAAPLLLVIASACRGSTGLDCPEDARDCGQPTIRVYALTVQVTSPSGAAVAGAAVRVEGPTGVSTGTFWDDTTTAQGTVVVDFSYQGNAIRPPQPIHIIVTPPAGSALGASTVADTAVFARTATYRERSIALPPLAGAPEL